LLFVFFDDDGTWCEGLPALEEDGILDEDGASDEGNDVLGKEWDDKLADNDVVLFFFIAGLTNGKGLKGTEVLSLCLPLEAETAVNDLLSMLISINESSMFLLLLPLVSPAAPLPDISRGFASDAPNISSSSTSMLWSSAFGGGHVHGWECWAASHRCIGNNVLELLKVCPAFGVKGGHELVWLYYTMVR
jgi:hypothetical protein